MSNPEISRAAGKIEGLSDAYLVAIRVDRAVEVRTFLAEARARVEDKERLQRTLTDWETLNREKILATPLDETEPAVRLAALVAATKADFNVSLVTPYAELVFAGKGITTALTGPDTEAFRVGRFARAHNGQFAPWSFLDSHSEAAAALLDYAREVL